MRTCRLLLIHYYLSRNRLSNKCGGKDDFVLMFRLPELAIVAGRTRIIFVMFVAAKVTVIKKNCDGCLAG